MSMTNSHKRATSLIKGLSENQAKAIVILLNAGVSEVATTAADAARATAAPAKPASRRPAAKPAAAPAKPAGRGRRAPEAVADVADEIDDAGEVEQVTLPENPTIDDLFDFLDNCEVEPQSRKITEARADVESWGGDSKTLEAAAESDDIGSRRDALEEFVAQCTELFGALTALSGDELKALVAELDLDAATIKAEYGSYTKETIATAIIVDLNAPDGDEGEGDEGEGDLEGDLDAAPAKPAKATRAPAKPAQRRQANAAPAKEAPAKGGRRRAVAQDDDLGDLEDL